MMDRFRPKKLMCLNSSRISVIEATHPLPIPTVVGSGELLFPPNFATNYNSSHTQIRFNMSSSYLSPASPLFYSLQPGVCAKTRMQLYILFACLCVLSLAQGYVLKSSSIRSSRLRALSEISSIPDFEALIAKAKETNTVVVVDYSTTW